MTNNITILCDFNYIYYAVTLIFSLLNNTKKELLIHFLCLDEKTFEIISKLKKNNIICYREDSILTNDVIVEIKNTNRQYYLWSLASQFSNFIMNNVDSNSVMYIDSDIFFHKDIEILYNLFENKEVGIFKHRFEDETQLYNSGKYNVGVVYFKNSIKGKFVLNWWADAVLHKKYKEENLHLCGDQKYLDMFPILCQPNEIFIDSNIGHGAPWNWLSYDLENIDNYEIIYKNEKQPLVFTHFSKFKPNFSENNYSLECYNIFTDNNNLYNNQKLRKIHDEYFLKLKETYNLLNKNEPYLITLDVKQNEKPGFLIPIEDFMVNMKIKRIFYILGFTNDVEKNNRGYHAHETTQQVLINITGSVHVFTKYAGTNDEKEFILDKPNIALVVPPNNYIKMNNFSRDAVFLVLCDTNFSEDIYIYE